MMTWSAAPTGAGIRPVNRHAQPEEGRWRAGGSTNDRTAFRGRLRGGGASAPHGPRLAAAPIRNHVPRAAAGSLAGTGCARAAVDPGGRARAPHRGRRRRGRRSEASALAAPALANVALDRYRGMPFAFWEIAKGDPVTGITLQRLTDALDSGIVLKQCHIRTVPKSYPRSREAVLLAGADLPAKVCRDLLSNRGEYVSAQPSRTTAPIFRTPKNSEMLSFLARTTTAKLTDAAGWLFRHRQWGVGIIHAPIHSFLDPRFRPEVSWLPRSDRRHFLADPFGIRSGKNLTILAEELDHAEQVGRVVAIECPEVGAPRIRRGILELAVHASYPYLVEHDGEIFCMPETSASEQVVLYKAVDFPTRW